MTSSVVLDEHVLFCFKVLVAHLEKKPKPLPNFENDD
jgi:hypothetical protein